MMLILLAVNMAFAQLGVAKPADKTDARLVPKNGSHVKGLVEFQKANGGLKIDYDIKGLKSNAKYGFHIHEKGDCSSPDGKSAGGHFNKVADEGGTSLEFPGKYAGDLPQIQSDPSGRAVGTIISTQLNLVGPDTIVGRSVVVHAGPDDPSSHSAPRIACGVIKKAF